jgi:hypothetical protein
LLKPFFTPPLLKQASPLAIVQAHLLAKGIQVHTLKPLQPTFQILNENPKKFMEFLF